VQVVFVSLVFFIFLFSSCTRHSHENVISVRHIHKYGYDISKEDWNSSQCPGKIVTYFRDGKTVVESYEDGSLHGWKTETYPHSRILYSAEEYDKGLLLKKIFYSLRGIPEIEHAFLDNKVIITTWFSSGSPRSREIYEDTYLIDGQYFNLKNELESSIERGSGERLIRDTSGNLLAKEVLFQSVVHYKETYYPNNFPHYVIFYDDNGLIHGEFKEFAINGEPIIAEQYCQGLKHGLCCYYQNGLKYLEAEFYQGQKHGTERQFVDGEVLVQETEYQYGKKQGACVTYCDGSRSTYWYFQNHLVSKEKYHKLMKREQYFIKLQK